MVEKLHKVSRKLLFQLSLSANPKHFSNTEESLKYLREIIIIYMKNQRLQNKLPEDQKALKVVDVFTGQITSVVLESYKENNILIFNVPANMNKYYQPLDFNSQRLCKAVYEKQV